MICATRLRVTIRRELVLRSRLVCATRLGCVRVVPSQLADHRRSRAIGTCLVDLLKDTWMEVWVRIG